MTAPYPGKPIIVIEQLVVLRGAKRVIDGLDLSVGAGMVYALLGGNGAGKTTTLNTLLGFLPPHSGKVLVNGIAPGDQAGAIRQHLAYLPENVALYPYLSGAENLRYFCALAAMPLTPDCARQRLAEVGLDAQFHDQRAATYSKGMRQKVGLAIAYAKHASAMLLDEPTSGLDPSAANDFSAHIRDARARGMAVLMATHDLFNAKQIADRIGIMKAGKLVDEFDAGAIGHDQLEQLYLTHTRGIA